MPARADRQSVVPGNGGTGERIHGSTGAEQDLDAEAVGGRNRDARALVHPDDDVGHVVELRGAVPEAGCCFWRWVEEGEKEEEEKSEFSLSLSLKKK